MCKLNFVIFLIAPFLCVSLAHKSRVCAPDFPANIQLALNLEELQEITEKIPNDADRKLTSRQDYERQTVLIEIDALQSKSKSLDQYATSQNKDCAARVADVKTKINDALAALQKIAAIDHLPAMKEQYTDKFHAAVSHIQDLIITCKTTPCTDSGKMRSVSHDLLKLHEIWCLHFDEVFEKQAINVAKIARPVFREIAIAEKQCKA